MRCRVTRRESNSCKGSNACLQGSTALLGTEAGTVRMFSLADGACELHLAGHNHPVTALDVCWSVCGAFDGPVAVSGAADGSARACACP